MSAGMTLTRVKKSGGDLVASMVSDNKRLYLVGAYHTLALEIDKLGTDDNPLVWHRKISGSHCSSPIVRNDLLFMVSNHGRIYCLEAESGKIVWRK